MNHPLRRRVIAEWLCTTCLVVVGCGAMVVNHQTSALTHVGVALAWGMIVMVMIYTFGKISGAHMNPAVTIALAVVGRLPRHEAFRYVRAQCLGAITGAVLLNVTLGNDGSSLGATSLNESLSLAAGFGIEFTMTMILMMVVMGVSTGAQEESTIAGIVVGVTIGMEAMVAGPMTKASMNPARSLGPALVSGSVEHLWLYLAAPVAGAIAGAWIYNGIAKAEPLCDESEPGTADSAIAVEKVLPQRTPR